MTNKEAELRRILIEDDLQILNGKVYEKKQELKKLQKDCPHFGIKWEALHSGYASFNCPHCGKHEKSD